MTKWLWDHAGLFGMPCNWNNFLLHDGTDTMSTWTLFELNTQPAARLCSRNDIKQSAACRSTMQLPKPSGSRSLCTSVSPQTWLAFHTPHSSQFQSPLPSLASYPTNSQSLPSCTSSAYCRQSSLDISPVITCPRIATVIYVRCIMAEKQGFLCILHQTSSHSFQHLMHAKCAESACQL